MKYNQEIVNNEQSITSGGMCRILLQVKVIFYRCNSTTHLSVRPSTWVSMEPRFLFDLLVYSSVVDFT